MTQNSFNYAGAMTTRAANGTIALMADMTPGQVFGPNNQPTPPRDDEVVASQEQSAAQATFSETPQPQQPAQTPASPTVQSPPAPSTQPAASAPLPEVSEAPVSPYVLPAEEITEPSEAAIAWTASEYIAHHKSAAWYVAYGLIALLAVVGVYFITAGDLISTIVVIFIAVVFGAYAARKPRVQQYQLSEEGVAIGAHVYSFTELKSFALIEEGPFSSISFMPLKRFMPVLSIYFDPQDEARIVNFLSNYLPMEQRGHDAIERFMRKIKF